MHFACQSAVRRGHCRRLYLAVLGMLLLAPACATAQGSRRDGLFITVPNPITDKALQQITLKVDDALKKGRAISTIVFDFNPNELPSGTSNFGSCYDLAKFIRGLQTGYQNRQISTKAFISNEVAQHTVLPVLACRQIVMSGALDDKSRKIKSRLGDIQRGQDRELDDTDKDVYRRFAQEAGLGDLVERMFNKNVVLKKVKLTESGKTATYYLSLQTIARWEGEGKNVKVQKDLPPGLEPGSSSYDAELAQKVGLCQAIFNTRADLAADLHLPPHSLAEDWQIGSTRVVWRIEVKGGLEKGGLDSLQRRINSAIARNANLLILQLEASGGDTTHVATMANWIRDLKDNNLQPIRTVAYVPPGASLGAATFLALGCSEIVMGDSAFLGDFAYLGDDPQKLESLRTMILEPAKSRGYPALLFQAALDPRLVLYRVRSLTDPGDERLLTEAEVEKDKKEKNPRWQYLGRIDRPEGQSLKISAPLAKEWGIARSDHIQTLDALYAYYTVEDSRVHVARDDWLDKIAEFFREPAVCFLLVMVGIVGLILELKMPGTTVPGVVAAVCFVLFFWAYSFVGEFTLLAALLFILGLILIGIEIFIIPGLGFTGISGLLLVITSLVLATLDRWPSTAQDWVNLGATFGSFGLVLMGAIVAAVMVAWYLPNIPYANRLVLKPPAEEETLETAVPEALLGAIGVAATPLRPAGKAQFGDDFLDVIAEGDFVNPGRRIQIIEIEGNRIVVKEV